MLAPQSRCPELWQYVENQEFFVMHAARQTGKTTVIRDIVKRLNASGDYHALYCSLEEIQEIQDPHHALPKIVELLRVEIEWSALPNFSESAAWIRQLDPALVLRAFLRKYCSELAKPLVLMLDETDCLSNGTLISFLRQLRHGYINREDTPFVHSLALVGMRNIRDYQTRVRDGQETLGGASPFNITQRALTIANFSETEVTSLYEQHTEATGQAFPTNTAAQIYAWTQGQPWLVNAIFQEVIEVLLKNDVTQPIHPEHIEQAVTALIQRRDTHVDSLLERLKEKRVRRVVEPVLIGNELQIDYLDDDVRYVIDLGLMRESPQGLQPANPMYGEVIIRTLTYNSQKHFRLYDTDRETVPHPFDLNSLLKEFQQFWRENSDIWVERYDYKEAAPHLILQAFLQHTLNGEGTLRREYAAARGRVDLCIETNDKRYPIELKLRYQENSKATGIQQLTRYMDSLGCNEGWLIVFDRRPEVHWDTKITWDTHHEDGKTVYVVGC